jgi:Icc-related predicted phosphoesterase
MDLNNMDNIFDFAESNGCEKVFVVGDFGFWPHDVDGRAFLYYLDRELARRNFTLHFIKGNHDNHEYLAEYKEISEIQPKLYYHPNLSTWKWGEYTSCAIGGAYSTDGWKRTEGIDWWRDEEITMAEVYGCDGIVADIVISHDCPLSVDIDEFLDNKRDVKTFSHRTKLQSIVDVIKPQYVIHGHYHERFVARGEHPGGKFVNIGLAANKQTLATQCLIFDCDALHHDFSVKYSNHRLDF